jgi:hypothetical protein
MDPFYTAGHAKFLLCRARAPAPVYKLRSSRPQPQWPAEELPLLLLGHDSEIESTAEEVELPATAIPNGGSALRRSSAPGAGGGGVPAVLRAARGAADGGQEGHQPLRRGLRRHRRQRRRDAPGEGRRLQHPRSPRPPRRRRPAPRRHAGEGGMTNS